MRSRSCTFTLSSRLSLEFDALADMKILAFMLVFSVMERGESSNDHIGNEATLIDRVLKDLPVKKCDSIIVSQSLLEKVGRSTIFFTNVDDLMAVMGDEEFVFTLSSMSCFILGSKSIIRSSRSTRKGNFQ